LRQGKGIAFVALGRNFGWIGVDVGTHAVKLAQVVREDARLRLHRAAVIQRPTPWSGGDQLAFDQPVSSRLEIRAARSCGAFSGRNAACTLPMNVCELRGLTVPPGQHDERRAMIDDLLAADWSERRVPMEFDFWELESGKVDKGVGGFNVDVMAVSRPWIDQLASDCQQAGLDCWVLDGAPLALARAVEMAGGAAARALAIDWGFNNTTFCVVGDGRPLYVRHAGDCGFGHALEAAADTFGVTLDQAQHLADTQGITPLERAPDGGGGEAQDAAMQAALADTMADSIERLLAQARRTLQFLDIQRRHLQPTEIWLMGGGASLRNIRNRLAHELQIPIHIWRLPCANDSLPCASGHRAALFAGAAALSALAWRSA
jgi:Tfp pilus assembly PilM family ATPase